MLFTVCCVKNYFCGFMKLKIYIFCFLDSSKSPIVKSEAKSSTKSQSSSERETTSDHYQSNHDRNDVSVHFVCM